MFSFYFVRKLGKPVKSLLIINIRIIWIVRYNFHVPITSLITKHTFEEHPTCKIKRSESEDGQKMQQQTTLTIIF